MISGVRWCLKEMRLVPEDVWVMLVLSRVYSRHRINLPWAIAIKGESYPRVLLDVGPPPPRRSVLAPRDSSVGEESPTRCP